MHNHGRFQRQDWFKHLRRVVGKFGLGERNERGDRLLDFCTQQRLAAMNIFFQHHPRRQYTWRSPGDRTYNQIDFILVDERWKSAVGNVKTYPGADCGSDHQLLVMRMRIRYKNIHKSAPQLKMLSKAALGTYRERIEEALAPVKTIAPAGDTRPEML